MAVPSRSIAPFAKRSVPRTPVTCCSCVVAVAAPWVFFASTSKEELTWPLILAVPFELVRSTSTPIFSPPKVSEVSGRTALALAVALPPPWVEAEVMTSEWTEPFISALLLSILVALIPFVRPACEFALAAPVVVVASVI